MLLGKKKSINDPQYLKRPKDRGLDNVVTAAPRLMPILTGLPEVSKNKTLLKKSEISGGFFN